MGTFCMSGQVVHKAGAEVSTSISETQFDEYIQQAESFINVATRYNWSDAFAGLNVDVKYILEDVCSNLAGIYAAEFDMSGYDKRELAEDTIIVLRDAALRGISILRDIKSQTFTNDA